MSSTTLSVRSDSITTFQERGRVLQTKLGFLYQYDVYCILLDDHSEFGDLRCQVIAIPLHYGELFKGVSGFLWCSVLLLGFPTVRGGNTGLAGPAVNTSKMF